MSKHWHPGSTKWTRASAYGGASQPKTQGIVAIVLTGAAAAGIGVGAMLATSEQAPTPVSTLPAEILLPEAQADAADAEWETRSVEVNDSPSTGSGRTGSGGGARVAFGLCHVGGGTNCVVDGDTFYIGGAKVRIAGIDTPETHPPRCAYEAELGGAATAKLRALLNSGAVTMTGIGRDRDSYGRLLRNVQVDGADVGAAMVGAGVAREYGRGRRGWC